MLSRHSKNWPKTFKILPKWQNFAKSGHTATNEVFFAFNANRLPAVSSSILFDIFPFLIVYGEDMVIQTIGRALAQVEKDP